ncbi:PREDICTED: heat shock factor-binding protein 1-like [Lipotes vexillifer]|uniref:Heat shock factor-binding protein 1 n=1 Tax=Lipotes vexillifer TaxID=118797 RepID=A0A340XTS9_LIPVE|nr:PREDICTED: heat shock factor-binding protein 1-like [Lipotes vexillifer]
MGLSTLREQCFDLPAGHLTIQPGTREVAETDSKTVQDLTSVVQTLLQQMQGKRQTESNQIIGSTEDMSSCIDDPEKNIADLVIQARVEELGGEDKTPAAQKS